MSPHDGARAPPPRPSRGHQPSFSAALLDAIYQSLEAESGARSSTEARRTPASSPTTVSSRHRPTRELSPSGSSVRSPRLQRPPRPCRVRPDPHPSSLPLPPLLPPQPHESAGDRAEKRRRNRKTTAKKTKVAPLACLLNALLCNRRSVTSTKSPQHTPPTTAAAFAAPEPASARSILSSRASRRESAATGGILTPARRAVRFAPVAAVLDDEHAHGGRVVGTTTRLRGVETEMAQQQAKESVAEAERRVEELLRALGVAEERERAKESSESSSDLFELESLPPAFEDAEPPRPRAANAGLQARPSPRVQ